MSILGLESLVFGVTDLEACHEFLHNYGLIKVEKNVSGGVYEALDGSTVVFKLDTDPNLPAPNAPAPNIRETIYGVSDQQDLDKIIAELSKDRDVRVDEENTVHSVDDSGFAIGFRITRLRKIIAPHVGINAPGQLPGRGLNELGVLDEDHPRTPRSLSHVVYFVPDHKKAEAFYADRLGFITTDRFINLGPFMRPAGSQEHHSLFLVQSFNQHMVGLNHFTFHFGSGYEVFRNGWEFAQKGYRSFWGPGRHIMGSNFFWYFNSPFGGTMEFDADMDIHDDNWSAREMPMGSDASQVFLFEQRKKWSPGE